MQRIKSGNIQKCDQLCYSVRYMSTVFIPESHFLTKTMTKVYEDQTGKNGDEIQWKIKYKWAQTMHWEVRENDRDRYGKWHARKKHTHITFMIKCSVQFSLDLDCPIRGNWVEHSVNVRLLYSLYYNHRAHYYLYMRLGWYGHAEEVKLSSHNQRQGMKLLLEMPKDTCKCLNHTNTHTLWLSKLVEDHNVMGVI